MNAKAPLSVRSDTPIEVFVEGDALYDAMLDDTGRAERSVRLESYMLTSDAVGHTCDIDEEKVQMRYMKAAVFIGPGRIALQENPFRQ